MKSFMVTILANLYQNNGEKEYCQKYIAEDCETEKVVAEHYTEITANFYPYPVIQKHVICESGTGAILKLQQWQREGLPETFLTQATIAQM